MICQTSRRDNVFMTHLLAQEVCTGRGKSLMAAVPLLIPRLLRLDGDCNATVWGILTCFKERV